MSAQGWVHGTEEPLNEVSGSLVAYTHTHTHTANTAPN